MARAVNREPSTIHDPRHTVHDLRSTIYGPRLKYSLTPTGTSARKQTGVSKITFILIDIRQTEVKNGVANQVVILSRFYFEEDV